MKHRKRFSNFTFKISEKIGSGCFGEVYAGKCLQTGEDVAIKKEYIGVHSPQLFSEMKIIRTLNNSVGFPSFFGYWPDDGYNALAETLLGNNLVQLFRSCNHQFTMKTIFMLADQMISRLEFLHSKDIIHRDIKPENFLIGKGKNQNVVYLADFGLSKFYRDSISHIHIPYREGRPLVGTARYISLNVHFGIEPSRRDDLESLAYLLIYFAKGRLPWQGFKLDDKIAKRRYIFEKKQSTSVDSLCDGLPPEFAIFLESTRKLDFEETPYYTNYKNLFRSALLRMGENYDYKYCWLPPNSDPIGETRLNNNNQMSLQNSTKLISEHAHISKSSAHLHCLMAENPYLPHNRYFPRSMDRSNINHRISLTTVSKPNSTTLNKSIKRTSILNSSNDVAPNSSFNVNTLRTNNNLDNNDNFQGKFKNNHANSSLSFSNMLITNNSSFLNNSSTSNNRNSSPNNTNLKNNVGTVSNNIQSDNLTNDNDNNFIRRSSSNFNNNNNNVLFILDDKKDLNANNNQNPTNTTNITNTATNNTNNPSNDSNSNNTNAFKIRKSSSDFDGRNLFLIIDSCSNLSNTNPVSTFNVSSSSNSVISNYNNSNNNEPTNINNTSNTISIDAYKNVNNDDQAATSTIDINLTSNHSPDNSHASIRKSQSDFSEINSNIQIRKSCSDFSEIKFDIGNKNPIGNNFSKTSGNINTNIENDEIDINSYMNHNIITSKSHKNNLKESLFSRYNKPCSSAVIHKGTPPLVKPVLSQNINVSTADSSTSVSATEDNSPTKIESVQEQQHQIQQKSQMQIHQHKILQTQQQLSQHQQAEIQPVQRQYPQSDLLVKKPVNIHQSQPHHVHHHHHHAPDDYLQQFELLHVKKPHPSLWSPNVLLSKHLV